MSFQSSFSPCAPQLIVRSQPHPPHPPTPTTISPTPPPPSDSPHPPPSARANCPCAYPADPLLDTKIPAPDHQSAGWPRPDPPAAHPPSLRREFSSRRQNSNDAAPRSPRSASPKRIEDSSH